MVDTLLFQPPKPSPLKESRITWIQTSTSTRIPAIYIDYNEIRKEHSNDSSPSSSPSHTPITILYSHANSEDLGHIYPWCKYLSKKLQVNIFAYDYTGYGLAHNQGPPTEGQCYADIDAAYKYLRKNLQIPAHRIVLYGRSLGTGPSSYLASLNLPRETPGGLILHAPFTSVYRIVLDSGCTLMGDQFPNIDFFQEINIPTLLIHGSKDDIVPMNHSVTLLEALRPEHRAMPFFREMRHNSVPIRLRNEFISHLNEYLDTHVRCSREDDKRVQ
jgi:fermentation-respiration switch protein FrsA (DUF1100 family)